jgi:hypothetical protein
MIKSHLGLECDILNYTPLNVACKLLLNFVYFNLLKK